MRFSALFATMMVMMLMVMTITAQEASIPIKESIDASHYLRVSLQEGVVRNGTEVTMLWWNY